MTFLTDSQQCHCKLSVPLQCFIGNLWYLYSKSFNPIELTPWWTLSVGIIHHSDAPLQSHFSRGLSKEDIKQELQRTTPCLIFKRSRWFFVPQILGKFLNGNYVLCNMMEDNCLSQLTVFYGLRYPKYIWQQQKKVSFWTTYPLCPHCTMKVTQFPQPLLGPSVHPRRKSYLYVL